MAQLPGIVEAFRFEVETAGEYTTLTRSKRLAVVSEKWRDVKQLHRFVWLGEQVDGQSEQPRRCVFKRIFKSPGAVLERMDGSREAEIMGILSHKAYEDLFVTFYGWGESPSHFHMCMEYVSHGSLEDCIPTDRKLPENEASCIVRQILEGLNIIHGLDLIHQDIKPQNILVKSPSPRWWVKIADFGFSRREISTTTSVRGHTVGYGAPELQDDSETHAVTKSVDIWSLGCLTHKLLTRNLPFSPRTNALGVFYVEKKPFNAEDLVSNSHVSASAAMFLQSLLVAMPSLRPTAAFAILLPWIQHHLEFASNEAMSRGKFLKTTPQFTNSDSQHKHMNSQEKFVNRSSQESAVIITPQISRSKPAPEPPPRKDALRSYGRKSDPLPNDVGPKSVTKQLSNVERAVQKLEMDSKNSLVPAPIPVLFDKQPPQTLTPRLFNVNTGQKSDSLQPNGTPWGSTHSLHEVKKSSRSPSPNPNQIPVKTSPQKLDNRVTGAPHGIPGPISNLRQTIENLSAAPVLGESATRRLEVKEREAIVTKPKEPQTVTHQGPSLTRLSDPKMQEILQEMKQLQQKLWDSQWYYPQPASRCRDVVVRERKLVEELIEAIENQRDYKVPEGVDERLHGLAVKYVERKLFLASRHSPGQLYYNGARLGPQKQGNRADESQHGIMSPTVEAAKTAAETDMEYNLFELKGLVAEVDIEQAILAHLKSYKTAQTPGASLEGLADPEMQNILTDAQRELGILIKKPLERGPGPHNRRRRAISSIKSLVKAIETQNDYAIENRNYPIEKNKYGEGISQKIGIRYLARRVFLAGQQNQQERSLEIEKPAFKRLLDARDDFQIELAKLESLIDHSSDMEPWKKSSTISDIALLRKGLKIIESDEYPLIDPPKPQITRYPAQHHRPVR